MKTNEEEKQLAESRHKARNFLLILIAVGLGLTGVVFLTRHTGGVDAPDWLHSILPLFYTIFYAIIAGVLIFFGIDSFDGYLNHYLKRRDLTNLISVSFVVIFCFLYSALFKQILENVFKNKIQMNEWTNLSGYIIGRFLIIVLLVFIFINKTTFLEKSRSKKAHAPIIAKN